MVKPAPMFDPLRELVVVDLSQGVSGPFCSMTLGDLGARVIKVEPLDGDWSRSLEPRRDESAAVFLALNRNKESVALDLAHDAGRSIVDALAAKADIVICDEHSGLNLGYDYARWSAQNPQLIYGLVTPFGEQGPWAKRPASELVVQAASGYPRYLGASENEPVRIGADVAGTMGGVFLLQGLLAALWHRRRGGDGQRVSVSQLGALYALKTIQIAAQHDPDVWEGYHCWGPYDPPDTGWQAEDLPIVFSFGEFTGGGPGKVSRWPEFCRAIGLEQLVSDPRFDDDGKNSTGLGADAARLRPIYEAAFRTRTAGELVELIRGLDGAAFPYHTHATLFADDTIEALGDLRSSPDSAPAGIRPPWSFSGQRCAPRSPAPALGASTAAVLSELGYEPAERTALFEIGVAAGSHAAGAGRPLGAAEQHAAETTTAQPAGTKRATASGPGPLAGIRVLDISGMGVGPVTGMLLAELGADVVKVEPPHGDLALTVPPTQRGTSVLYIAANIGKRGAVLDLKDPEDLERARRLVAQSDVFIENFRVGVVDRLGLGYEGLAALNPGLVYCSLSGFGQHGPLARLPSIDTYIQAFSGFASLNGARGKASESLRNIGFIDLSTAALAVPAILAALVNRERSGRGEHIEATMLEAAAALQTTRVAEHLVTGQCPPPCGSGMPYAVPDQAFLTRDGYLAISARTQAEWARLCSAIGREDLVDDPRYETPAARIAERDSLVSELETIFGRYPRTWWINRLEAARVPCGRFHTYDDMCEHPQVRSNGLMTDLETDTWGTIRVAGLPWTFSRTPGIQRPGPMPGRDTDEVLAEIGRKPSDVD
jgi:crotonobetainyl-CoA:carnitine CoA-transferase CaiB-like acyl-CoA transferase